MRALRYIVPIALFAVLAGFLLAGLDRNPNEIPSPLIGKPAPAYTLPHLAPDAPVTPLDSRTLAGAPYLLNVWASWCTPCLQEHPLLLDLSRRKLIRIVGINYKDRPDDARAWLRKHGDPFAITVADRDGRTAIDFGVYGVPETFLIDAGGVVRFKQIGPLTAEAVEKRLLPAIRTLSTAAGPGGSDPGTGLQVAERTGTRR